MKQTAVEWLMEQICGDHTSEWQEQIKQAKAMEKQQIENALQWSHDFSREIGYKHLLYNYYKETYESNT